MKKKPAPEPIISSEIFRMAKGSVGAERSSEGQRCAVCGGASIPLTGPQSGDEEELCWVCRRLKISAWRETDQQASVQE